jgi:2-polyprenyl-3-methyl-5-hydroxy-6-metoxy-1,4-benzoquinol methylase
LIPCAVRGCTGRAIPVYRLPKFAIARCDRCEMMFRDPLPTPADLSRMYNDRAYHESAYFAGLDDGELQRHPEIEIYDAALVQLAARKVSTGDGTRGSVLDVGCGSGAFLKRAAAAGWIPTGVELSHDLAVAARESHGFQVLEADFATAKLPTATYDVITMWDFLEHVVDPVETLHHARRLLAPDGVLVVFTIDSSSLFNAVGHAAYRVTLGGWTKPCELLYDERHCFFFTASSLAALLARSGFRVTSRRTFRAHLSRWLSRPVSLPIRLVSEGIDLCSTMVGRPYRQLLFCEPNST